MITRSRKRHLDKDADSDPVTRSKKRRKDDCTDSTVMRELKVSSKTVKSPMRKLLGVYSFKPQHHVKKQGTILVINILLHNQV